MKIRSADRCFTDGRTATRAWCLCVQQARIRIPDWRSLYTCILHYWNFHHTGSTYLRSTCGRFDRCLDGSDGAALTVFSGRQLASCAYSIQSRLALTGLETYCVHPCIRCCKIMIVEGGVIALVRSPAMSAFSRQTCNSETSSLLQCMVPIGTLVLGPQTVGRTRESGTTSRSIKISCSLYMDQNLFGPLAHLSVTEFQGYAFLEHEIMCLTLDVLERRNLHHINRHTLGISCTNARIACTELVVDFTQIRQHHGPWNQSFSTFLEP
jgi:hypothetical protein